KFDADFGRLVGYYLAEGYIYGNNGIGFCFNANEKELIKDVKNIVSKIFGLSKFREYYRKGSGGVELSVSSELLTRLFKNWFYLPGPKKAKNKALPSWMLTLNREFQSEILLGWWRGDKGYTVSRELVNQMKTICLRLKILPGVGVTRVKDYQKRTHYSELINREIEANSDLYYLSRLAFIEDRFSLRLRLNDKRLDRKLDRKHGWIDDNYAYLPIRKIEKTWYEGEVHNLEVAQDNSYTAEFASVHNCWTPWFALYGSKSGFDSVEECFGKYANRIYAVETGLSSDPMMNWQIADLDKRAIVSFSDAHSPKKLAREATVFSGDIEGEITFDDVSSAISERFTGKKGRLKIAYTIEFYPEEGKYHYTGHRTCGVVQTPEETRVKGTICHVCGRPLTVGVMHRVEQLGHLPELTAVKKTNEVGLTGYYHPTDKTRPPYVMLVPLHEIIAESLEVGVASKRV
ncbi:MAG: LAGLIDADG family homing endonuclease, partial [Patescibacteria group bacterium]|nr:LAGLIDADG family homing endonuclease [Patescibacteria group bacterium]